MKKEFFLGLTLIAVNSVAIGQELPDSLKQIRLEEVIVSATRANNQTPVTFSNLNAKTIKQTNAARNLPLILETLPSVVAFTEDGLGVGNSSFRIRGTDATRINVTINGMPLNNPESQEVYWVNIPDLSNSVNSLQVQRGVGTSTNGAAAFGASISIKTNGAKPEAYGEASTSVGSYNTFLSTIAAGTGILKNGLSFDGRYSRVLGDGYIRNGKVNHKSAYLALSHYSEKQLIKINYLNGIQHTGITWEGISPEQMKEDRRYNPAGRFYDEAGNVHYYDNETDNYYSDILQLNYSRAINQHLTLNTNFSYNHGHGYYENYKPNQKFKSKFGLSNQIINDVEHVSSDVIRRKGLSNNFYVTNFSLDYTKQKLNISGGGMFSIFDGNHYGNLYWVKFNNNIPANYQWYYNTANKKDINFFTKANLMLSEQLSIFGDIQYRYIDYNMNGIDDDMVDITNRKYYNFVNPKAGIYYKVNTDNELYGSLAIANREPLRADIKESIKAGGNSKIEPEKMYDYELGYRYNKKYASFSANIYYMHYKNQMVQTGKLNDVGYKLMENVPKSYRLGLELVGAYQFTEWLRLDANITLSKNKINNYTAYFDVYEKQNSTYPIGQDSVFFAKTNISFSPNVVGSSVITISPIKDLQFMLIGKYVGKQFYDNTSNIANQLPSYFVTNFSVGYTFKTSKIGKIDAQFFVNNIFDKEYVANAWVATDMLVDGSKIVSKGLFPQATRNFMVRVGVSF